MRPIGWASRREGVAAGLSPRGGGCPFPRGLVTEVTSDVGCAFISGSGGSAVGFDRQCVRRYHLCTRKSPGGLQGSRGPTPPGPVSAGLLTVGQIRTVGPAGWGDRWRSRAVLGLAKALKSGMLGLYHPSRSGAP